MPTENRQFDIVWYLSGDWETDHRRQMILSFAKNMPARGKILCVNRPFCMLTGPFLKTKKYFHWIMEKHALKKITDNLYAYTPYVILHDRIALKVRAVSHLNKKILSINLKKVIKDIGFESLCRLSWIYVPYQVGYLGLVDDIGYVYENYDDYPEFDAPFLTRDEVKQYDTYLAKNAFLVFATALKLYKEKLRLNPKSYYVPNAVNLELFARHINDNEEPQDLKDVPRPIVGFVGNVHQGFVDTNLIKYITSGNPSMSFVFIGKMQGIKETKDILKMPNVYYLGYKIYEDIPNYIRCFNLGIIPFKLNKITESLNPLKLFEYMAVGCPVLSTDIPEVRKYSRLICIANGPEEFDDHLKKVLASDVSSLKIKLRNEAKHHSWDNRTKEMVLRIQESMGHTTVSKHRCFA